MADRKGLRRASHLSRVGGSNCVLDFDYWKLVGTNRGRLCDISRKKHDWGNYFQRKAMLISLTLDLEKRKELICQMHSIVRQESGQNDDIIAQFQRFAGEDVAKTHFDKAMSLFARSKEDTKEINEQRGNEHLSSDLFKSMTTSFKNAIMSARLSGNLMMEARACANLGTALHHGGKLETTTRYYMESLAAFRLLDVNGGHVSAIEKKILNALALALREIKEHEAERIFCLIQLRYTSRKRNLNIIKKRLSAAEKQLALWEA